MLPVLRLWFVVLSRDGFAPGVTWQCKVGYCKTLTINRITLNTNNYPASNVNVYRRGNPLTPALAKFLWIQLTRNCNSGHILTEQVSSGSKDSVFLIAVQGYEAADSVLEGHTLSNNTLSLC